VIGTTPCDGFSVGAIDYVNGSMTSPALYSRIGLPSCLPPFSPSVNSTEQGLPASELMRAYGDIIESASNRGRRKARVTAVFSTGTDASVFPSFFSAMSLFVCEDVTVSGISGGAKRKRKRKERIRKGVFF
jgi:hypothetical protein